MVPTARPPTNFRSCTKPMTGPAHQVYFFPVVRYPEADLYLAFPPMWYPMSAIVTTRSLRSRATGSNGQRPSPAIIRLGMPGSGREGYIDVTHGMIRRGNELWLYYTGLPERHLSPTVKWESIFARAIYRLDGFISATVILIGGNWSRVRHFRGIEPAIESGHQCGWAGPMSSCRMKAARRSGDTA